MNVRTGRLTKGVEPVRLETNEGIVECRFHPADNGDGAVVWVGGAGGGLDGPAGGLYPRLANQLVPEGIASLRLDYRFPNELEDCVLDTLMGVAYLGTQGKTRVALVAHSFGGAVVITAGANDDRVVAVAALSSQTAGTTDTARLAPRPLMLTHGLADQVLPDYCSRDIYRRAHEPKELILYPGCHHGLDECRDDLDRDLLNWLRQVLQHGHIEPQ